MTVSVDHPCPVCGQPIPERPRGSRRGNPPKTCGERCRKIRAAQRERQRYQRVKGTTAWQTVRAAYAQKLRDRLAADPELAAIFRAEGNARTRAWREKLRATDPARHAQMRADSRAERAAWRRRLESDPAAWEAHKARCRAWYAGLSDAERDRIYYEPRRRGQSIPGGSGSSGL